MEGLRGGLKAEKAGAFALASLHHHCAGSATRPFRSHHHSGSSRRTNLPDHSEECPGRRLHPTPALQRRLSAKALRPGIRYPPLGAARESRRSFDPVSGTWPFGPPFHRTLRPGFGSGASRPAIPTRTLRSLPRSRAHKAPGYLAPALRISAACRSIVTAPLLSLLRCPPELFRFPSLARRSRQGPEVSGSSRRREQQHRSPDLMRKSNS